MQRLVKNAVHGSEYVARMAAMSSVTAGMAHAESPILKLDTLAEGCLNSGGNHRRSLYMYKRCCCVGWRVRRNWRGLESRAGSRVPFHLDPHRTSALTLYWRQKRRSICMHSETQPFHRRNHTLYGFSGLWRIISGSMASGYARHEALPSSTSSHPSMSQSHPRNTTSTLRVMGDSGCRKRLPAL
jgi:hypothetical protein